jgi:hypothetical protein
VKEQHKWARGRMQPVMVDGWEFKLLRDEDPGNFHRLSFDGKVTYLEQRVDGILISPCRVAMDDAIATDIVLILVTAICAGISAAAAFLKGNRAGRGEDEPFFIDFVRQYMDPVLTTAGPFGRSSWAQWLYKDVRSGLAHSFTIESGGMRLQDIGCYVKNGANRPEIHTPTLLDDFASGWLRYLGDVRSGGETSDAGQRFQQRFDHVFHD